MALFWADGAGTVTPPGHWNEIAIQFASARGYSLSANARLFAELNVAMADAAIAAWDAKYAYGEWRPVTAIQQADTDDNAQTAPDAAWTPFLVTPNFPTFVSGHSTFSGAAEVVLASFFGAGTGFTATTEALGVGPRDFTSFRQAAEEAGQSRILGGIHFQFDNQAGLAIGRDVASYVLQAFSVAADTHAPSVHIQESAADLVTATNVTIHGQVLDNLSGVASLRVALDDSDFAPLAFDASGNFTVATTLATDGSADGPHVLHFEATDHAGNVSASTDDRLTLDTRAPVITLSGPGDGATLPAGSQLAGTADATGSTLVGLTYAVDGQAAASVAFDPATGEFAEPLDHSRLGVGSHSLVVTARDAAGNTAQRSIGFHLASRVPLTITEFTPEDSSEDVGVTTRPRIAFSRPVDLATLTAGSVFATDPSGATLPATIAPAADGTFAWLFFAGALPGASTITVHVDGSAIRAAGDAALLDADGDGTPGGTLTWTYSTVGLASTPGTRLVGTLADPGPDLKPGTLDDVRRGPDGILMTADDVYVNPIEHVRVYLLGMEDHAVFTDAQGHFELRDIPAGHIKVAVDGLTATNAPAGVYYPEMVMDLDIRPAETNTVMAAMEPDPVRAQAMPQVGVYLPRLRTSLLQDVSDSQPTTIGVDAVSAPDLTPEQRQFLRLDVQPNSILGADGQPLANPQIGISTVSPDFVRDMLPPEFRSQHQFEITIQAPRATVFTTPIRITFPNLQDVAPGGKVTILSFDHTTGLVVPDGTGTVSEDGLYIVSDPGSGIRAPGWHFVAVGTTAGGAACYQNNPNLDPNPPILVVSPDVSAFFFQNPNDRLIVTITNRGGRVLEVPRPTTVDPAYFLVQASDSCNQAGTITASEVPLQNWASRERPALVASPMVITSNGGPPNTITLVRLIDAADSNAYDGVFEFNTTAVGESRGLDIEMVGPGLSLGTPNDGNFKVLNGDIVFEPSSPGPHMAQIPILVGNQPVVVNGQPLTIKVRGVGVARQVFNLDRDGFDTSFLDLLHKLRSKQLIGALDNYLSYFGHDDDVAAKAKLDNLFTRILDGVARTLGSHGVQVVDAAPAQGQFSKPNYMNEYIRNNHGMGSPDPYIKGAAELDFDKFLKWQVLRDNPSQYTRGQLAFQFAELFNLNPGDELDIANLAHADDVPDALFGPFGETAFVSSMVDALVHEFTHLLGGDHVEGEFNFVFPTEMRNLGLHIDQVVLSSLNVYNFYLLNTGLIYGLPKDQALGVSERPSILINDLAIPRDLSPEIWST